MVQIANLRPMTTSNKDCRNQAVRVGFLDVLFLEARMATTPMI
jgi:hypothetical protein